MSDLEHAKNELSDDLGSAKVEALVEAMFLAATADGEFAPEEALQFAATVGALTDRKWEGDALHRLIGRLSLQLKTDGRQKRIESIAARLPPGKPRETAIILAAAITASDGEYQASENDLVADLADKLGVDPERAIELVQKVHRR
ncbi:MAG: hypothetical protein HYV09_25995 [Deltaproteobacteria bacterium]|nr:hypothetical protein [Deltaproteobacteria bacterium]